MIYLYGYVCTRAESSFVLAFTSRRRVTLPRPDNEVSHVRLSSVLCSASSKRTEKTAECHIFEFRDRVGRTRERLEKLLGYSYERIRRNGK